MADDVPDTARAGFCGVQSKLLNPCKPDSYLICTNDPGHENPRHTACDGQGHVTARWRSGKSPVEVWGPWGVTWA